MSELVIDWEWALESALHCGSGVSQAGFADRLIQRDEHGRPIVPGDAVKGALRLSAEQIFAWLGNPQEEQAYGEISEPQHALLDALFGGAASARFEAARLQQDVAGQTMCLPGTRINRTTGRADDDTLRTVEVLAPGAVFRGRCRLWASEDEERSLLRSLLLASLLATESIGGRVGTGWGRIKVQSISTDGSEPTSLTEESVEALEKAMRARTTLRSTTQDKSSPIVAAQFAGDEGRWWKLDLTLEEPICLGMRPDVANQQITRDYIPATGLRGALRAAWMRAHVADDVIASRLGTATYWTNAHPATVSGDSAEPAIPIPRTYTRLKTEAGFGSEHGIHDVSSGVPLEAVDPHTGKPLQWHPLGDGWMCYLGAADGGAPQLAPCDQAGLRESRMHVARNYTTGSKRSGALFSREAITPTDARGKPRRFVAYAKLPGGIDWQSTPALYIGKRTSAGYGRVTLKATEVEQPWPQSWLSKPGSTGTSHVIVQLLSDALIRDSSGAYLRSIPAGTSPAMGTAAEPTRIDWSAMLGAKELPQPKSVECRLSTRPVQQWMSTWGHPRSAATAIAAGSVWRLNFATSPEADTFRKAAEMKRFSGIGERTHEGFGWFAVDPPWLGRTVIAKDSGTSSVAWHTAKARPWPGCESVDRSDLRTVLATAAQMPVSRELRGPLQELATRLREARTPEDCRRVREYCESMASRGENVRDSEEQFPKHRGKGKNAYAWTGLRRAQRVRGFLDGLWGDERLEHDENCHAAPRLRFAVEVLLSRCPVDRG